MADNGHDLCKPGDFSFLVVGSEVDHLQALLDYALSLSPRQFRYSHSGSSSFTASVVSDTEKLASYRFEAGALLLATGGSCLISMDRLNKADQLKLQQTLELGHVVLDIPERLACFIGEQMQFAIESNIWCSTHKALRKQHNQLATANDAFKASIGGVLVPALIDTFPLVLLTDSANENHRLETEKLLIEMELLGSMQEDSDEHDLVPEELEAFVTNARKLRPIMTEAALIFLEDYFTFSRKRHGSVIPLTVINTLKSMAVAFCKLSMCTEVSIEHALIAVLLYEETLCFRSDQDQFGVVPQPHLVSGEMDDWIGEGNDDKLYNLLVNITLRLALNNAPTEE